MPEIVEYDYYEALLSVTIATQRPEGAASGILYAAALHEEFAARVRAVLREYRKPLDPYLPYYSVDKLKPAACARDIDREFNQDVHRQQFALGLSLTAAAWVGDEVEVFAFERNIEKAVKDLFAANSLPNVFIPGDESTRGPSFIDVTVSLVGATNQGIWHVA